MGGEGASAVWFTPRSAVEHPATRTHNDHSSDRLEEAMGRLVDGEKDGGAARDREGARASGGCGAVSSLR